MREYQAFLTASADHVSVAWLALAGRPLNQQQRGELERLLDEFFRKTGHRSFQQHAGSRSDLPVLLTAAAIALGC